MLVLSRKPGETVRIGKEVTVTVVEVKGRQVKLAIRAPEQISIWRGELRPWEEAETEAVEWFRRVEGDDDLADVGDLVTASRARIPLAS